MHSKKFSEHVKRPDSKAESPWHSVEVKKLRKGFTRSENKI